MANVAVVHVPFYSHIEAANRLSAVLSRQGHGVTAWAPEDCREGIESNGASFKLFAPEMPRVDGFMAHVAGLAAITEKASAELIEQLFAQDVDVLIHDSQVPWARVAGDYLGIPRIVIYPMFPIAGAHLDRADDEKPAPAPPSDEAQARFEASWLSIARRWGVELGQWGSVIQSTSDSDTVLTFTTEEILGDYELRPGWHCIGPLMERVRAVAPPDDRQLVYVCFGTSFNARVEHFRAAIAALAEEPVDVLVSTGGGIIAPEQLEPLPANVEVRDFVSGRDVLTRARVHVTHGGCNSVHESLLAGVPMVLVPQAWDQFPLAGRVERLGAGLVVEEDPEAIRSAVRRLLGDGTFAARAHEIGQHLESYDGERRVASVLERVLTDNAVLSG